MPLLDSETAAGESFPGAASPQNAPVNSPRPANGIVGASDPLRLVDEASDGKLVDGAHSRPDSKIVAHLRDAA